MDYDETNKIFHAESIGFLSNGSSDDVRVPSRRRVASAIRVHHGRSSTKVFDESKSRWRSKIIPRSSVRLFHTNAVEL